MLVEKNEGEELVAQATQDESRSALLTIELNSLAQQSLWTNSVSILSFFPLFVWSSFKVKCRGDNAAPSPVRKSVWLRSPYYCIPAASMERRSEIKCVTVSFGSASLLKRFIRDATRTSLRSYRMAQGCVDPGCFLTGELIPTKSMHNSWFQSKGFRTINDIYTHLSSITGGHKVCD